MLDSVLSVLGDVFLGLCAGVCAVAYWLDARRRSSRKNGILYAKMRPLSRSTTERRD